MGSVRMLSLTPRWGPQTLPGEGAQRGSRGLASEAFMVVFLYLSDWPGARSGLGDIDSVGHGVTVTYSYEVRTVIPIMLLNSEVTPTRGKGF